MATEHNFGIIGENGKAIEGVTLTTFSDKYTQMRAIELAGKNKKVGETPSAQEVEKTMAGMNLAHARHLCGKETLAFPKS